MKFEYFEIKNFKGIEYLKIDLNKAPNFNVHTLVGLNESGKTTILEAINYFKYKTETLDSLELKGYRIEDVHDIIPIGKRANFNGTIEIKAGLILDDEDDDIISKEFKNHGIIITKKIERISFTQKYFFENSKNIPEKNSALWNQTIVGRKIKAGGTAKVLTNVDAIKAFSTITSRIPNILFFPNFLFEFPHKIYLDDTIEDNKHKFYKAVIQDILDSLGSNMNLKTHIVDRATSSDKNDRKHLESVLDKMGDKVTNEVFAAWSKIFNKKISKKEIIINQETDDEGVYLEFLLKDTDGKYLINERSLGFRWFFVFLLFTRFRGFRKENENALFLLDEPASNLHSTAQIQLLQSFERLPEIIYTTHSHHLINPLWLESTFIVKNEGLNYDSESDEYNSTMTKITATPYRVFAVNHPDQRDYFQPILDVLAYAPSDLEFAEKSIFVEGKNDYYSYNYLQKTVLKLGKKELNFLPGTSSSNMSSLISLYLGWGKPFIILLDSDAEGIKQKARYIELFGTILETRIITYADIEVNWENYCVEDIYTSDDREKIIKHYYPSAKDSSKKILHKAVQELMVKHESIALSATTKQNFKTIFDFLYNRLK